MGTVLVVTSVDGTFCSLLWQRNNTWIILVENVVVIMKSNMKKITITEFEEIISKKEDLKERAKGITGKGDDLLRLMMLSEASLIFSIPAIIIMSFIRLNRGVSLVRMKCISALNAEMLCITGFWGESR